LILSLEEGLLFLSEVSFKIHGSEFLLNFLFSGFHIELWLWTSAEKELWTKATLLHVFVFGIVLAPICVVIKASGLIDKSKLLAGGWINEVIEPSCVPSCFHLFEIGVLWDGRVEVNSDEGDMAQNFNALHFQNPSILAIFFDVSKID